MKQLCPLRCWAVYWRRRCLSSASSASRNIPSNRNIRFPQILYFFKNKNCISPNSCLRYFPISYRAVNGCCTAGRMVIGNTPLDIWQILVIKFLYSIPEQHHIDIFQFYIFFLEPSENGSQKITSLKDGQNLCDKVILLGHLLLRFLSWRKFFSSDTLFSFIHQLLSVFTFLMSLSKKNIESLNWIRLSSDSTFFIS